MSDMKDRVTQVILAEADVGKGFIPDHAKNKFSDNSGNLKCPICGNVLEQSDGFPELFMCLNCQINMKHNQWQELIRTRKALDVAVDALNTIKGKHDPRCAVYHIDEKTAYDALEQITALEQKE